MPKFHYADFPETSPDDGRGSFGEVGVMEFGLYVTIQYGTVCKPTKFTSHLHRTLTDCQKDSFTDTLGSKFALKRLLIGDPTAPQTRRYITW